MSSTNLDNLVKAKQLKSEPPDQNQVDGMIRSARNRLTDLQLEGMSDEGKFLLAYGAVHSLSLAACRLPLCDGMAIARKIVISYFSVCRTRLDLKITNGVFSLNVTI